MANEPAHRDQSFRRYRLNSLLLLFPLAVPVLAIRQERQKAIERGSSIGLTPLVTNAADPLATLVCAWRRVEVHRLHP